MHEAKDIKTKKKEHKNRKFAAVKHLANSRASCLAHHSKNRHYIDSRIAIYQMLKSRVTGMENS